MNTSIQLCYGDFKSNTLIQSYNTTIGLDEINKSIGNLITSRENPSYMRFWEQDGMFVIDFGSWSKYYFIKSDDVSILWKMLVG